MDSSPIVKQTCLHDTHVKLKAKILPFGGFLMPISYSTVLQEHHAVRTSVGVFDISHMGELQIRGAGAFDFLQYLIANNLEKLTDGQILYTPLCNETGGVVDDILVYQRNRSDYLLVVNASNTEKVFCWVQKQITGWNNVTVENDSDKISLLAIQGPKAEALLKNFGMSLSDLQYYHFKNVAFRGCSLLVSRTGYTGEDGFEIFVDHEKNPELLQELWDSLFTVKNFTVEPIGLGARDTLRLECCFSLYGHELLDTVSPIESGIGWTLDMQKKDFIGKNTLKNLTKRKLVAFELVGKGIPRAEYPVWQNGNKVGVVTSGSLLPTVQKNAGLALIESSQTSPGASLAVEIRAQKVDAIIVTKPFYLPVQRRK
jgi:aminomethyltransferase